MSGMRYYLYFTGETVPRMISMDEKSFSPNSRLSSLINFGYSLDNNIVEDYYTPPGRLLSLIY